MSNKKQFLEIAKIVAVHGIRGEVRCQYFCDSAGFLCEFETLFFDKNGEQSVSITRAYPHKNVVIMKISGIDAVEQAQKLIGKTLYMNRADVVLPDGVYYIQDIIGLTVKDFDSGEIYGKITDVYQNGANDVYSIKKENGRELMFPCVDEVVKKIDLDGGEMLITPLEGLFDED